MTIDIVEIIGNVSRSLFPVQSLLSGLGYLLGIICAMIAIGKFKKIGDSRSRGGSSEHMFVPVLYLLIGAGLIFLPTTISALSNTMFGTDNALSYAAYNPYDIYSAMVVVIQTTGLLWFVRGTMLLVHASEPGVQEGPKGLVFVIAGIGAMNFEASLSAINYLMSRLTTL